MIRSMPFKIALFHRKELEEQKWEIEYFFFIFNYPF